MPEQPLENTMPEGLKALMRQQQEAGFKPAPVHLWDPPFCGALPMVIKRDGSWHYMGSAIQRRELVRLFAQVLMAEGEGTQKQHYLVTPVEKVAIEVELAAFLAVEMVVDSITGQQRITLRTNQGEMVEVGAEHKLRFAHDTVSGGFLVFVQLRHNLEAVLTRTLTMDLCQFLEEVCDENGVAETVVRSMGLRFVVPPSLLADDAT
ncbi:DUF1285 domain-containing protein [Polycladidibacter stylochi]|uniref:DUF1285 domain-containing protein n=1 Tax=Polycladidibacter stylochi TaxID=1807766 RepID=UPI000836D423|nr:DUF1285 domain-containing protein [Pseudovibrio stylochi]